MSHSSEYPGGHEAEWRRLDRDEFRAARRRYRSARTRAEQRARLKLELVKYCLVCGLLLLFFRPVGLVIAIVWGLRLLNRYYHTSMYPGLRRQWVEREMRRAPEAWDPDYRAALEELDAV
jgi:hypothetical protein